MTEERVKKADSTERVELDPDEFIDMEDVGVGPDEADDTDPEPSSVGGCAESFTRSPLYGKDKGKQPR